MTVTYLNGKLTLSGPGALAVPTPEDLEKINQLTDDEKQQLINERLTQSHKDGATHKTLDDAFASTLKRYKLATLTFMPTIRLKSI